ncbi:MAG: type I 3-dehydroquinate dehydratase [Salinivirgaceae bacterium]|jgi:3-dehydroquinate dehydratase type I|nr:type I 3-dehydroquinate dehydratase [Salinivirgaceae bacterium]
MLCRSIAVEGFEKVKELLNGAEMAEIRIEKTGLSVEEVKMLFQSHNNLIATCRVENNTDAERTQLLSAAIEGGAKWIDLELESENSFTEPLIEKAKIHGCTVIISYHNYEETPDLRELTAIIEKCISKGAELVKLATRVNKQTDITNLLSLYSYNYPMLALGMGKLGNISRVAALKLGAPFTFVSCDSEEVTAPGQITESEMNTILNIL